MQFSADCERKMNQLITIAKVGGRTGEEILSRISDLQRLDSGNNEESQSIHIACTSIRKWVERHASTPPVLFYCRYADVWSGGDLFQRMLGDYGSQPFEDSDGIVLAIKLPEDDSLIAHMEQRLRGDLQFDEQRLFLDLMLKATRSWTGLTKGGAILVFRDVVGSTVTDDELLASLETNLWLQEDIQG